MKEIKYRQKYVRQLVEGGLVLMFHTLAKSRRQGWVVIGSHRGLAPALRCFQKVDGYDRQSEDVVRITSNTLSPKGKEDFT